MFKCKICGKTFVDLAGLYTHIEKYHESMIPENMLVPQYYYYMKTGKTNGNCVVCKQPTTWNKNTSKYNRFCGNPACKEKYVAEFRKRMISKYGKVHLLNDPNKQREMLANRKISGQYRWDDGTLTPYTGSLEHDWLKLLDNFFDWDPVDISMPSPHTYTYMHEGVERFYIPDAFIHSLDLEVEIKDGGDNPNMHHKIQSVDKVKEKLKDEVLTSQKAFHYIKITNKNYTNFFNFLKKAKEEFVKYEDEKKIPRIFMIEDIKTKTAPKSAKTLYEAVEVDTGLGQTSLFEQDEIQVDQKCKNKVMEIASEIEVDGLITESFISDVEKAIKDINKLTVFDFDSYVKINIDAKKDKPEDVQNYILKLIKASKCEQDMILIRTIMKKYMDYTEQVAKSDSTKSDIEKEYKLWVSGKYKKEYDKKLKKITESIDYIEFERADNAEESKEENDVQLEEGAMSFSQLNKILADGDHKRIVKFIDDYESYHKKMVKDDPSKSESFNNELRRALQYIKDLEKTGKVDNELARYAIGRLDHGGLAMRPKFESAGIIANMAVVVGAEETRSAFNLTDTSSKIFIDDNHYFSRPDGLDSMNCILKTDSIDNNIDGKRVLRYNIKPNNGEIDMSEIIDKYVSNTMSMPGLFKLTEANNSSFIKGLCNKLGFGECEITLVEDKTY